MNRTSTLLAAIAIAAASCLGGRVQAGDSAEQESLRHWIKECLVALNSPSQEVRSSARHALVRLRPTSLRILIEELGRVPGGTPWDELSKAARAMDEHMLTTLAELRSLSNDAVLKARLEELVESARKAKTLGGDALAGVDPSVAEVLEKIDPQETSFSSGSVEARQLVKLGRQAVPGLVLALAQCDARSQSCRAMTAAEALRQLVNEEDAAELERLVLGGRSSAAYAIEGLPPETAAKILAGAFDRDLVSLDVTMAAGRLRGQKKLVASVAAWLERHLGDARADQLADLLGVLGEIGDESVLPLLRRMDEELTTNAENRWKVPAARIRLGDPDAVRSLLATVRTNPFARGPVADALILAFGTIIPERVWPSKKGAGRDSTTLDAEAFAKWWDEDRSQFSFNRDKRRWERAR